jgi:hypothetical protein
MLVFLFSLNYASGIVVIFGIWVLIAYESIFSVLSFHSRGTRVMQNANDTVVPPAIAWLLLYVWLWGHCDGDDEGSLISLFSKFE